MAKFRDLPPYQRRIEEFFTENMYMGMPMVHTTDGYLVPWEKTRITDMLALETTLAEKMFDIPAISEPTAEKIADEVERRIRLTKPRFVSGPMVREITNNILLEWSHEVPEFGIYRNLLTRVGAPVYDAYQIDTGGGFEAKENANLQPNPETIHKKKADRLSKEQYLLLMDPKLATAHHQGDIHIHTLEYFGSRPFCQDWDLRYFLYYGLIPDGSGFRSSVAGPAKQPEVA
ncbi:MAG TPA: anaerobic ribonucleoside-triphosphate reductase, partial [Candidatus Desulfaltia sp.]|nr:anaerobic ribonucleoside-triphosphate reductase [Candidatus Desulfaltia sp.]